MMIKVVIVTLGRLIILQYRYIILFEEEKNKDDAPQATFSAKLGASTGPSDPQGRLQDSRD